VEIERKRKKKTINNPEKCKFVEVNNQSEELNLGEKIAKLTKLRGREIAAKKLQR
jgi:hypothetical protein